MVGDGVPILNAPGRDPELLALSLSPQERAVLKQITGRVSLEELLKRTGLGREEVLRALMYLENKGVVRIIREERAVWRHTELGRRYVDIGLPETRLLRLVREGKREVRELKEEMGEELGPALGILKALGIAKVREGRVEDLGGKIPWEKGYRNLELGEEELRALEKRGLVEREVVKEVWVEPTEIAEKVREHMREDLMEELTPEMLREGTWKGKVFRRYDVESPVPKRYYGKRQPYYEFLLRVKERLFYMGFREMEPMDIVIPMLWNNDALFMPQDHPASDIHDIYFVKAPRRYAEVPEEWREVMERIKGEHEKGWKYPWSEERARRVILRSHATALSAYLLYLKPRIPGRYFTISRVFRPDEFDYKHLLEFNQLDGVVLGEEITFRDLVGLLKEFAMEFAGTDRIRVKPAYFPFTEPSAELFVKTERGWMEIGGAGMFREELLRPFGIEVPVIAWGLGLDRFAMLYLDLKDIRDLFSRDLEFLRRSRKVVLDAEL